MFSPLISGIDFTSIFVTINGRHEATLDAVQTTGGVTLNVRVSVNAVTDFVIVAFAIF